MVQQVVLVKLPKNCVIRMVQPKDLLSIRFAFFHLSSSKTLNYQQGWNESKLNLKAQIELGLGQAEAQLRLHFQQAMIDCREWKDSQLTYVCHGRVQTSFEDCSFIGPISLSYLFKVIFKIPLQRNGMAALSKRSKGNILVRLFYMTEIR